MDPRKSSNGNAALFLRENVIFTMKCLVEKLFKVILMSWVAKVKEML